MQFSSIIMLLAAAASTALAGSCEPGEKYCGWYLTSSNDPFTPDELATFLCGNSACKNDVYNMVWACTGPSSATPMQACAYAAGAGCAGPEAHCP